MNVDFKPPFLEPTGVEPSTRSHHTLVQKIPEAIIMHSNGCIGFINKTGKILLNIDRTDSAADNRLERFIPVQERDHLLGVRVGHLSTQLCSATGELIDVNLTVVPVEFGDHSGTVWVIHDLRNRIASRNELTEENRQRERLAFDLHDSIGQQLTGISLLLRAVGDTTTRLQPSTAGDFKFLADLISKAISDVRILAGTMSSVTVERIGLAGALKLLQQKSESIYRLKTRLSLHPAAGWTLDSGDANQIFRVIEEAISNVARHAQSTLLEIEAHVSLSDLVITVLDDGIGITETAFRATGLGLRSMRYRAEKIGGSLTIEHNRPRGTSVQIRYPLRANR